ncbi:LLM class flavin-dependent oxidoreductase [Kutzneria sp. NPDC052558]|uniref:LLM class flavin-dependent oxidoreductase n=1 Tax=Kutzneria sp. NPDC052558 TaxID=3364121 RepID=UPI0037C836C9
MTRGTGPRLAVALDGAGWHPAAWRSPDARPADVFGAGYWLDLVREAEAGTLDFVTFRDSLALPADGVRGRLDAVLVAARIAPLTSGIGLVPEIVATHTEPFHLSKAIATLDYVSTGRGGVQVSVSSDPAEYRNFGRREFGADIAGEAADYVEVLRRLWDSWEDDAEIRDVATGRFVDREKLHYIDFEGRYFSVRGPSITPRPPQGQPLVTALQGVADSSVDVVYVTPQSRDEIGPLVEAQRGRQVFADLVVFLDSTSQAAADRRARLDSLALLESDALVFAGTPEELAELLLAWHVAGLDGFRLRPAELPHDLHGITRGLVPELRSRGTFRKAYEADTLRGLLGLDRPANRYVA